MSIEAGARAGMIAPDEITYEYLKEKPMAPKEKNWDLALKWWASLPTDQGAKFDTVFFSISQLFSVFFSCSQLVLQD